MWLYEVIVLILFTCLSNAEDAYYIPKPNIEVLDSNHLQISIEDHAGVTFVAFNLNIKEHVQGRQVGEYSKELYEAVDGRWTFNVSKKVHLNDNDTVHYWVFVIQNRMGYTKVGTHSISLQNGTSETTEIHSTELPPKPSPQQAENCKNCTLDEQQSISTTTPSSSSETNKESILNFCKNILLNTTQNLLNLQSQLENSHKYNQQLTSLLEHYPDAKILKLTTKVPPNNEAVDPVMSVKFFIREKLDLNPDIVSAVIINNTTIEFKLATVAEKLDILEAAKVKLVDSKFSIC